MAILRFRKEPTPVVFREGINGKETVSTVSGEREIQHFVNQYRDSKDTIYLPDEAQRLLERLNPRPSETVLIAVSTVNKEKRWYVQVADASDAAEPAPPPARQPAPQQTQPTEQRQREPQPTGPWPTQEEFNAAPPAPAPQPRQPYRQIESEPGGPHQMNYPPQAQQTARQTRPEDSTPRPEARVLASALCTAIDAAIVAQEYAERKGRLFAFDADSIRAMAISLYIEACKQRASQERAA